MINLGKPIAIFFLMVCASNALASGWTKSAKVLELTASAQQVFVVRIAVDKTSCKSKDTFYLDYSIPGAEFMYHTLLAALVNNKAVELQANGVCELNGYEGFSAVRLSSIK